MLATGVAGIVLPSLCFFIGPASQGGLIPGLIRLAGLMCSGSILLASLIMLTLVRREMRSSSLAWWSFVLSILGLCINGVVAMMLA